MADNKSFESTLHDIVYSIDTGTGLKIIRIMLYVLVLLLVMMLYTVTGFRGLKTEESMDLAQLGRNMSFQSGLVTKCVRPASMAKIASLDPNGRVQVGEHPDLYHPPAYPAVLAVGFKFFDLIGVDPFDIPEGTRATGMHAEQWVVLPMNHLFTVLTGWLIFSMGKRLFSREIGLISMSIYFLSDIVWADSVSGLNVSMAIFFIMASFHAMVVAMLNRRDGHSKTSWLFPYLISIVCAVIAFLTRYIAIAVVPGICLFAWLMGGRFRGGTRFVVIFMILYASMITPWLIRNYQVSGNPMGLAFQTAMAGTEQYPDNSLARNFDPKVTFSDSIQPLKEKWVKNVSARQNSVFPGLGGGILISFFLVTFFYHFIRPQVNYLRWGVAVSMLSMLVIAGFFSDSSFMMLHAFWPFAVLYGLSFFYILLERLDLGVRLYNIGLKFLIVAISATPWALSILPPHEARPYPPYHAPIVSKIAQMLTPREVMCTDMPWAVAWYGDRVSILLPKDVEQFYDINDYKQNMHGLYFTTITKDRAFISQLVQGPEKTWFDVFRGAPPADFPLKQYISISGAEQTFLSDRNRWSGSAESQAR